MTNLIEVTNGFRAWGFASLMFGAPLILYFVRFAVRHAHAACAGVSGHLACAMQFSVSLWDAGRVAQFQVNTWVAIALLAFSGLAGGAIFVSSNFLGGYASHFLSVAMLALWALITAAGWSVVIFSEQRLHRRKEKAIAAGMLLVVLIYAALQMEGQA